MTEEKQPLLDHYQHRPGSSGRASALHPKCPGCRVAHLRDKNAPVPFKLLVLLGFVILANALPIAVVYPFLYFMIEDLHVAKRKEDIGYYAGWIGSSLMIGRMLTGVLWGVIADRYGRRKVMVCGILSVVVFNTLFGLSTSLWMALLTRFLLGGFNGMLGTVKAYASEICSEQHQTISMSMVSTMWGFGLIIGPAMGGYLAQATDFSNFSSSVISCEFFFSSLQPAIKYPNIFKSGSLFARFPYLLQALGVLVFALIALVMCFYLPETLHKDHTSLEIDEEDTGKDPISVESDTKEKQSESIFRNWGFISSTMVYCLWSLHDIAYTEIFSLWAVSGRSYGGLGFTSSNVGEVLAISGLSMLLFQLTLFPIFAKWLGPIRLTRVPTLVAIPILTAYPFFSKLHGNSLWAILLIASITKLILGQATFTGSFILINNSVKQAQRGAANGFSLSIVSLFKAIGPAGGGSVFAWCQTRQHTWLLPGDHLVFFFLNFFALLTALMTCKPFLPSSTAHPILE
ncbi:hypothetical protein SELMODRAFT_186199 [Selaginella moellendorffii]|uniref:Major facilitator superfamily (MFS) profile domain-containing protein n=1 Tax=Selaginella moellendorffii TaxID=88036 RepID=D8T7Q6_SELML|nr:protein ZINC INDUCED FACILITATOR-LIKE 1 isoform X1 [Selaginella moellendorffii]XP_024521101.1 protein ZINC INDUCED FACILITATOR-LIKE 1 isoform X1 [Selaginella moellendorffii]EFJ07381.1 hypothetical protein SELMODRAFT_186199 [Selaginella moellendorffii]|eukprot:XP_002991627.1 protein ZINC INDUCED FACILITATOR-LIKE 1 isoform X1 [Selaginella moellendorffii]